MFGLLETIQKSLEQYIIPPIVYIIIDEYYLIQRDIGYLKNYESCFYEIKNDTQQRFSVPYIYKNVAGVSVDKVIDFYDNIEIIYGHNVIFYNREEELDEMDYTLIGRLKNKTCFYFNVYCPVSGLIEFIYRGFMELCAAKNMCDLAKYCGEERKVNYILEYENK
jgi:hypothetical protein